MFGEPNKKKARVTGAQSLRGEVEDEAVGEHGPHHGRAPFSINFFFFFHIIKAVEPDK